MRKLIRILVVALLGIMPLAHAAVIDFNNPGVIAINNDTNQAVYQEAGFSLTGTAAGFLTIDGVGTGGTGGLVLLSGNSLGIMPSNGGLFNFSALDAGSYNASSSATLTIMGTFGNNTEQSLTFTLAGLATQSLSGWTGLTGLTLTANNDVVVDNLVISAVPEPGSIAMLLTGLVALLGLRRPFKQGLPR